MASGIGITLGIIAGAAAIGLTAGLAAPAIGLVGATAAIGGVGLSSSVALTAGVLALGAGMALTQSPAQPEPVSQVARQLATTSDQEMPWETVYGTVVKGGAMAWTGVAGGDQQYTGIDIVIASHPCDAVLQVQVGDWTFPFVTSIDGDTDFNGLGLMLNTGLAIDGNVFPADWYVPVKGGANGDSEWWHSPNDDNNSNARPHIGIKLYYGTQTANDPHMVERFGTKYSNIARKYIGHTVAHVIVRISNKVGTTAGIPEITWRLRGKNDILDHNGANPGYTSNPALIFADYCRETFGIPAADIVGVNPSQTLQGVAAECDDTTWAGAGGLARYEFNAVIRDDEEPIEVMNRICAHMAGGFVERGEKVAIFTGTIKPTWSGSPFTVDDLAGDDPILITPPDQDSWANTIVPHRVVQMPNDEDGKRVLYGKMEPTAFDVTSSTYVTEDGGVTFRQDAKFPGCNNAKQAKWLAWTVLKQMRLGASMTVRLKKRAGVLERGDVFTCNFPDFFPNGTKFQVVGKRMLLGPETFAVELDAVRYEDAIYTPDTTPSEDAIGVVPRNRSSIMPAITGLAAEVEEDSAQVNVHGRQTVDVLVSWNLVPNVLVRSAGDVRVGWKKASNDWPGRATTVPGDEIQAVLPGLLEGVSYHIRARAEGTPSAGRTDKPRGEWTANLAFTPTSGFISAGRPGTATLDYNEISNPNFRQKSEGWQYVSAASGTTTWLETGGRFGTASTEIVVVSHERAIRPDASELIPVEVGQRRRFRFWRRVIAASGGVTVDIVLRALYYSSRNVADIVSSTVVGSITTATGADPYKVVIGNHTVPDDPTITHMRLEAAAKHTDGGYTVRFDAFALKRVLGATGPMLTDVTTLNSGDTGAGETWTTLRSITVGKPGDPIGLSFSWESRLGDPGNLSNPVSLRIRVRRSKVGGSEEIGILAALDTGNMFTPAGDHSDEWSRWETLIGNATDDTTDAGTFVYWAEFSTDRPDAKVAVRNRIIGWRLESTG